MRYGTRHRWDGPSLGLHPTPDRAFSPPRPRAWRSLRPTGAQGSREVFRPNEHDRLPAALALRFRGPRCSQFHDYTRLCPSKTSSDGCVLRKGRAYCTTFVGVSEPCLGLCRLRPKSPSFRRSGVKADSWRATDRLRGGGRHVEPSRVTDENRHHLESPFAPRAGNRLEQIRALSLRRFVCNDLGR